MERKLLLLGLLRLEDMHGYQLNEFIDTHLGSSVPIKKPTAYNLLKRMEDDGWIIASEEQAGNRPPRRVYTVTEAGEAAFQQMLRAHLARYTPDAYPSVTGIVFLDALPPAEAVALLRQRRAAVVALMDELARTHDAHPGSLALALEHRRRHLVTDRDWIDDVIAHLDQPDPANQPEQLETHE